MKRAYRFWVHYNKPMTQKTDRVTMTVHWRNECLTCNALQIMTPTEMHVRKTQPRVVMRGWAYDVTRVHDMLVVDGPTAWPRAVSEPARGS